MQWRRTDPVQTVDALIAIGASAVDAMAAGLAGKTGVFRTLKVELGDDWAVLFAASVPDVDEAVLPHLAGVTPLYRAARDFWLPVGVAMAVPDHARDLLLRAMLDHYCVALPAIAVPRFAEGQPNTGEADLYLIRDPVPFSQSALSQRRVAT
ncbi:hypothetical protein [Sphingomonas kyeonggiensis]|uniref:Uncharacterized protein n=1 Tax=Sphingomonas kyeonggiensis TaxID=1268553 RepID=A0A7W6JRA1_9SPHN|nr:hypothetical protein [Sphingomonas kyeonggiensis]MBB4098080.1 hypothetical protein [Sphingomonas kyeonggiensis]